ncbi:hypothetical protein LOK49_LG14G00536 [Camellia lanceoleosa]|uniref:Uncharacterized protein n=1 Tax=Camellia lanceoleosa TaxID=1840588 RepID=A0ACC0FBH7_9ERIC|nr:hypothetical protein LOK49_LG14G00536 [Camellia lanceoleosa]
MEFGVGCVCPACLVCSANSSVAADGSLRLESISGWVGPAQFCLVCSVISRITAAGILRSSVCLLVGCYAMVDSVEVVHSTMVSGKVLGGSWSTGCWTTLLSEPAPADWVGAFVVSISVGSLFCEWLKFFGLKGSMKFNWLLCCCGCSEVGFGEWSNYHIYAEGYVDLLCCLGKAELLWSGKFWGLV